MNAPEGIPRAFFEIRADATRAIFRLLLLFVGLYVGFFVAVGAAFQWIFTGWGPLHPLVWRTGLALGAMTAAGHALLAHFEPIERALRSLGAAPPDPADSFHRVFRNVLEETVLASPLGRVEAFVLPTTAPNALALADRNRAAVAVTEGLLARLRRDEIQAVVAHEVAHLVHGDTRVKTFAFLAVEMIGSIRRWAWEVADGAGEVRASGGALLVAAVAGLFEGMTRLTSLAISRSRETRADASAVEYTRNPLALASALRVLRDTPAVFPVEATPLLLAAPASDRLSRRRDLSAALFSTHPPIEDRISALLAMVRVDRETLEAEAARRPRGSAPPPVPTGAAAADAHYWIHTDGVWAGPLPLSLLFDHPAFGPEAWVADVEAPTVVRAGETAALRPLLEARAANGANGRCPRCRTPLAPETYEGTSLDRCHWCGGVSVRSARLARIQVRRGVDVGEEARGRARRLLRSPAPMRLPPGEPVGPPCPRCGGAMLTSRFSHAAAFVVDRCLRCDLVWFDRGELELAQAVAEDVERAVGRSL